MGSRPQGLREETGVWERRLGFGSLGLREEELESQV